ncbi:hypothetical protein PYW07_005433 [Mythimna separata]|uniref:EGF-like domain-containing protein n=1 Tax=Mythimna separata TaxID=271217 RepID=A0AAD7YET7_MYTSE|nr:hypothetical protein PYW07_005433 [Mythimna separata]
MCGKQYVLALLMVYVGLAHSWDVAISIGDVLEFYTDGTKTNAVHFESRNLTAIKYDEVHNMMLFIDKQRGHDNICGYSLTSKDIRCFVQRHDSNIHDLAFDPATDVLFFTDTKEQTINWVSLKKRYDNGNILLQMYDRIPSNVAVDSCNGYIYWTNWKSSRGTNYMERAKLFSSETRAIYRFFPVHTFAIDPQTQKNYFITGSQHRFFVKVDLKSENYNRNQQIFHHNKYPSTEKLAVSNDYMYWVSSSESQKTVWQILKNARKAKPKQFISFNTGTTVSIATNYRIQDQVQGRQDCELLSNLKQVTETEQSTKLDEITETDTTTEIYESSSMEQTTELDDTWTTETLVEETTDMEQTTETDETWTTETLVDETTDMEQTTETDETWTTETLVEETTDMEQTTETDETWSTETLVDETTDSEQTTDTEQTTETDETWSTETFVDETTDSEQTTETDETWSTETLVDETTDTEQTTEPDETWTTEQTAETKDDLAYRCNATCLGCEVYDCLNYCFHGNCRYNENGQPACRCDAGYSGERCEVYACHRYCLNNGHCSLNEEDEPVCQCVGNYEGSRCETVKNKALTFNLQLLSAKENPTIADLLSKTVAKISVTVEVL